MEVPLLNSQCTLYIEKLFQRQQGTEYNVYMYTQSYHIKKFWQKFISTNFIYVTRYVILLCCIKHFHKILCGLSDQC